MADDLSTQQLDFRSAMANVSAAVNVITTDGVSGRAGITVSAVCSVTDSPPTLVLCVNQSSYCHDIFRTNRRLAINVLGAEHQELAMHFAGMTKIPMADRFDWPVWDHDTHGVPVLRDAAAVLVGRIGGEMSRGSHTVMFVEVDHIAVHSDAGALIYFQRSFHGLSAVTASA